MKTIYLKKGHPITSKVLVLFNNKYYIDLMAASDQKIDMNDTSYTKSFKTGIKPLIDGGFVTENPSEATIVPSIGVDYLDGHHVDELINVPKSAPVEESKPVVEATDKVEEPVLEKIEEPVAEVEESKPRRRGSKQ